MTEDDWIREENEQLREQNERLKNLVREYCPFHETEVEKLIRDALENKRPEDELESTKEPGVHSMEYKVDQLWEWMES